MPPEAKLTPKQRQLMDLMTDGKPRSKSEVFEALGGGRSRAGTTGALKTLRRIGLLRYEHPAGANHYADGVYTLAAIGSQETSR